jgi:ribosome-binding factor A
MTNGNRSDRIGEQIRGELSTLLARTVRDPGATGVTVTHVEVTRDLHLARVSYKILSDDQEARRKTGRALRRAKLFLRRALAQRLHLRHIPELRFVYDETGEQQERIARLLSDIANERATIAPDEDDT